MCWGSYILYPTIVFRSYPISFLYDNEWCAKHSMEAPNCVKRTYTTLKNIKLKTNLLHNKFYVSIPSINNDTKQEEIRTFVINREEFVISPRRSLKEVFLGNRV